jgi:methyl-accepting chemotaxis protein
VVGGLAPLTGALRRLADGERHVAIAGETRRDEVGSMSRALDTLQQALIAADELTVAQASERTAKERRTTALDTLARGFDGRSYRKVC